MDSARRAISIVVLASMLFGQAPVPEAGQEPRQPVAEPRGGPSPAAGAPRAVSEGIVDPEQGGKVELDGARVELPPGAVSAPTRISIRRLDAVEDTGESIANVTSGAPGYRFEPRGIRFGKPVIVRVPFDRALLRSEAGLSNLFTYFYDEAAGRWERLARRGIDREAAVVTSETTHFTDMINATLRLPESPKPIGFDVNSIKNLQAADPAAEVPAPDGPEPGPFGANSFRIPLRLPPGRGGASPSLSLGYSSDSQYGWLGRGFDIEIPAVTIDTRFGLPNYEGEDRYSLGGEELERVGAKGASTFYRPRVERDFRLVRWVRSGGEDYWETTDKDGTVREYGRGEGWVGPARSDRSRTFAWYLAKQRDAFGNTVSYDYAYDSANAHAYLSSIRYSGFESAGGSEEGIFRIDFASEPRQDRRCDARGAFASKLAMRLSRIDVYAAGARVRGFLFDYGDYNEFGQSQLRSFSETDGAGNVFYTYRFEYFALRAHAGAPVGTGYDGFGSADESPACETWSLGGEAKYDGLSSSMSASISGSLGTGFRVFVPTPPSGRKTVAELSIHGGVGASMGGTTGALLDANSDGLADLAWRDGDGIAAFLNTGSGFDSRTEYRLSGLKAVMDKESSCSISYGAAARISIVGCSATRQESWSTGHTAFSDLDGDGRLDFVEEGRSSYKYNTGSGFRSRDWLFAGGADGEPAERNDSEYQAMYYLQEPVRAWEAWRSGRVEVEQSAASLDPARQSPLVLCAYAPGSQTDPAAWIRLQGPGTGTGIAGSRAYDMTARSRLFFRVDSCGDERNSGVSWRIRVRYTSIRLFEDLENAAVFLPAEFVKDASRIAGAERLYSWEPDDTYHLLYRWRSRADYAAYRGLAHLGRFVAKRISADAFAKILERAEGELRAKEGTSGEADARSQYEALMLGFGYEPETLSYLRLLPSDARDRSVRDYLEANAGKIDEAFMNCLYLSSVSYEDRERMAFARAVDRDGRVVVESSDDGEGRWYDRVSVESSLPAEILPAERADEAMDGMRVEGRGLLLDTRALPFTGARERIWLRNDPRSRVVSEVDGVETELAAASPSTSYSSVGMKLTMSDYRVPRAFGFSGASYRVESLPEAVYDGPVTDYVLAGEPFSGDSYRRLPTPSFSAIAQGLSDEPPGGGAPSDRELFESSYLPSGDGSSRELAASATAGDLERLLPLLEGATAAGGIFRTLPSDSANSRRIVRLHADELSALLAAAGSDLARCFTASADGAFYYLARDIDEGGRDAVLEGMRRYYRDVVAFPYYERDDSRAVRRLKEGLSDDEESAVSAAMQACGLFIYGGLEKTIRYESDQELDVSRSALSAGVVVDEIAPAGGRPDEAGDEAGVVIVPTMDSLGRTTLAPRYLRAYDSASDYSASDLTSYPGSDGDDAPNEARLACFQGGVRGWYYGLWTGNYPWSEADLGAEPANDPDKLDEGEVANPPYTTGVRRNALADGLLISASGREDAIDVPAEAWVGGVSSYGEAALGDDGSPSTLTYRFAAFMDGERWFACRNGGDSYRRLPNKDSPIGAGGALSFVREGHSRGTDKNYPGGLGVNASESWQYCGLMDMNGDRYPDLVKFKDARAGASAFSVLEGSFSEGEGRAGFGASLRCHLPEAMGKGWLSRSETKTWSVGASPGAAIGAVGMAFRSSGRAKSAETQSSGKESGVGFSASFGSSVQSAGFFDLNGDGLPDYVERGGSGSYRAGLNRGDGRFDYADWGGGGVVSFEAFRGGSFLGRSFEDIGLKGISHTAVGSFGGSLGFGSGKVEASASLSGSVNRTLSSLVDVNGDGLPDIVAKKPDEEFFRVCFNLGDRFSDRETRIYRPEWPGSAGRYEFNAMRELKQIVSGLKGIGLVGKDLSKSMPNCDGIDIPSPGKSPFSAINPFRIDDDLEYSTGVCLGLGAGVTFAYSWYLLEWFIALGVNGSVARTSVDLKFTDIDGDGLPDHALRMPSSTAVYVKRNLMGRVGLLRTMRLPQGGTYSFAYERAGNTVDMPQSRWVLGSLIKDDGSAGAYPDRGARAYAETYSYSDGYYDRSERMFYGFAKLSVARADGSIATTSYLNGDYYTRGITSGTELVGPDSGGNRATYRETSSYISKIPITGSLGKAICFPALTSESLRLYEAGTARFVETGSSYDYDAYGNVSTCRDLGLIAEAGDDLVVSIRYADLPGYLRQHPESIRVADGSGRLLRWRRGSYGRSGELLSLEEYDSETSSRRHELSYDRYGNLAGVTDPRGFRLSWEYDGEAHAFPVAFWRGNPALGSPGYSCGAVWSCALGKKLDETDDNGQVVRYTYDGFGRLTSVRSPYDSGSVPAVAQVYDHSRLPWTATTSNKLLYDPEDARAMKTVVAIDGLGRVLQTAKEGEFRDADGDRRSGWNLSGAIAYDAVGRPAAEGQPRFAEGPSSPAIAAMQRPTAKGYDCLGRPVRTILPDGASMTTGYQVMDGLPFERSVDPLGNATMKRYDGRGNITLVQRISTAGAVLASASYEYDGLGEMLAAADANSNAVRLTYDLSGRRTSMESPDAGKVILSYDEAGNLAKKTDSALRGRGEAITYEYDGLERLVKVNYPRTAATRYVFGERGAANGGAGRLVQRIDSSGTVRYEYGLLGETTAVTRSLDRITPLAENLDARFEYVSDYLGRMQRVTYPDGEVLSYGYDSGGQLASAKSEHNGLSSTYVADIAYDAFGQRTYIEYGNGVKTSYAYDENRRWLSAIRTTGGLGLACQDMSYRFDLVGNVLGYSNVSTSYETSQSYGYDGLYQLTAAEGTSVYRPHGLVDYTSRYSQGFAFDALGNMTRKTSSSRTSPAIRVGGDLNYAFEYSYNPKKAHQAERIGDLYYRYDANGNMIEEREGGHGSGDVLAGTVFQSGDLRITDTGFGIVRQGSGSSGTGKTVYCRTCAWDEENRLIRSTDNGSSVDYRYGADGQRSAKYTSSGESLYFDSMWSVQADGSSLRQMKNVYVGQTRIASRLTLSGEATTGYEKRNTYYYHPDHLGSVQLVTDFEGGEYERIEYTPYGESWIEKTQDGLELLPYKFTGKELDAETGMYYYGARYLNPKTSAWLSADPALGDYIPLAPADDEARERNAKLPGMGGVFNLVNLALYRYAGNNPVKYVDPDGNETKYLGSILTTISDTSKGYIWPTDSRRIVSSYGPRIDAIPALHLGIDIGAIKPNVAGDPLYAIADGVVLRNGMTDSGCSRLELQLPNGDSAVYIHGDFGNLKIGDKVKKGDIVGKMSDIGSEDSVHLHFEIRQDCDYKKTEDPLGVLPAEAK
jgi:RHS repeat-associated protein